MSIRSPYSGLPDYQFWKKEAAINRPETFDPVAEPPFKICPEDAVVTAGSCFAQHVAHHLSQSGFNHFITETAHPMFPKSTQTLFNYGMFAARYGNIYTARQLKQLLQRAYENFEPITISWAGKDGKSVVDPFRPQIQPGGFVSEAELQADQTYHFASIRKAIEQMKVFVFTLGLTECWIDKHSGAVYPVAPGIAGGIYDPETVEFYNFNQQETVEDLLFALNFIREKNPDVKFVLTVSPVPLNATKEDRHVFVSSTWSKAVLRVAAEEATQHIDQCVYFPSFEIITSPFSRGQYFAPDCRSVTDMGVRHVMHLFIKHFGNSDARNQPETELIEGGVIQERTESIDALLNVLCDEEAINNK